MKSYSNPIDPGSTRVLDVALHPVLWAAAIGLFLVIAIQTVIYFRAARRAAPTVGMTDEDVKGSIRAGAVAALGPSLSIALVAITLLGAIGTPAVLIRIGLVGGVAYETAGLQITAGTLDSGLGANNFTQYVFIASLLAMCIGGSMWMVTTLVLTPILKRGSAALEKKRPQLVALIPTAALFGALGYLSIQEVTTSWTQFWVVISGGVTMAVLLAIAKYGRQRWLREWSLGISIIVALTVAHFIS